MAIVNPSGQEQSDLIQEVMGRLSEMAPLFTSFTSGLEEQETVPETVETLPQTATEEPIETPQPTDSRLQAARQALSNQQQIRSQVPGEI